MNVKQLIQLLGKANPDSKVYFEDIYGAQEGFFSNKEITSIVWNDDEATLTNE